MYCNMELYAALGHCSKNCTKQEDEKAYKCVLCMASHTAWAKHYQKGEKHYKQAEYARSMRRK